MSLINLLSDPISHKTPSIYIYLISVLSGWLIYTLNSKVHGTFNTSRWDEEFIYHTQYHTILYKQ